MQGYIGKRFPYGETGGMTLSGQREAAIPGSDYNHILGA
jgi:hypothetical protein